MRLTCPWCGDRDLREFTYRGARELLSRPSSPEWNEDWHAYLHLRDNPAGAEQEIWCHTPCGGWAVITRNRTTHEVEGAEPASGSAR